MAESPTLQERRRQCVRAPVTVRTLITDALEAFRKDSSPALFWQVYDQCESDEERAFVQREVAPAMMFRWPKKRGPKLGASDRAFKRHALAVKECHELVAASEGKLSMANAVRDVAPRYRFGERYLARMAYGEHAAVRRLLPEIFCRAISP
jgi:hypothetical protein